MVVERDTPGVVVQIDVCVSIPEPICWTPWAFQA
jgi:hypothetical protein